MLIESCAQLRMRMVNSLLTQLDGIKRFPNVLVLATSNLTGSIDQAFMDR